MRAVYHGVIYAALNNALVAVPNNCLSIMMMRRMMADSKYGYCVTRPVTVAEPSKA
jgi:hypothetical protein